MQKLQERHETQAAQLYQGYIVQQNLSELILSSLLNTDAQRKMQTHDVLF